MQLEMLNRLLMPIKRSLSILIAKALLTAITDGDKEIQIVQVDLGNDQATSDVERVQNFGFTSHPKEGAQAIVLSIGGNRDHQIVIVVDDSRFRPSVAEGDAAMYNSDGLLIELKKKEILMGDGKQTTLTPLDGVVTGQTIDSLTGIPLGSFPGGNSLGTANSQKLKLEL